jgi:hypothetical protein
MSIHREHLIPSKFWLTKPFRRILPSHHHGCCHRITLPTQRPTATPPNQFLRQSACKFGLTESLTNYTAEH